METLTAAIVGVVGGDLKSMDVVVAASHRALSDAAATLPRLLVSRSSLAKVLQDWRRGRFSADDVQRWASFVRRGYVSGAALGETRPLTIDYEAAHESLIVDVISRLDELGDKIDGHIDAQELEEMIRRTSG